MPRPGSLRPIIEPLSRRDPRLTPPLVTAVGAIVALAAERARSADEFAALREAIRAALENAAPDVAAAPDAAPVHLLDQDGPATDGDFAAMLERLGRR
jgi:hypothetical protein